MVFKPQLLWWNVCKTWNIRFLFHWWINRKHPLPWWFPNFHIFYNSFQKFLFIFVFIRARWSKWILRQCKPPVPTSWSSRIKRTERWLFLISAAPPWCGFGETGWLDNIGISLAGGIPSASVTTWGLWLPSPDRTPGAGMFVPAPVSKAAPALKEELTNGHCAGVADERSSAGTLASGEPKATEGSGPLLWRHLLASGKCPPSCPAPVQREAWILPNRVWEQPDRPALRVWPGEAECLKGDLEGFESGAGPDFNGGLRSEMRGKRVKQTSASLRWEVTVVWETESYFFICNCWESKNLPSRSSGWLIESYKTTCNVNGKQCFF